MSQLQKINVSLSDGQKRKLAKAYRDREEVSIKLAHKNLSGGDTLMVPENIVKRLAKSKSSGKGIVVKIARANIRKQTGSGILNSLFPVIRNFGPLVGKTMGLSALAGLASEGVGQLVRKISGGQIFQVPNKHLQKLAMMDNLLTKGQIRDLAKAYTDNSDMLFKVTNKQVGNGIGSILATIGIPLLIDAFKGKGVKGRGGPRMGRGGMRIGQPPPYIGNWPATSGMGKKKKELKFKKTVPMSNFDLLDWSKYLKIPIKSVLSRDQKVPHNHQQALFIYNLEPAFKNGSHWVATYVKNNVINYFDSFGLQPFQELVDHAKKKNLTLLHQDKQLQNLYSSLCGYYCLYFLNEMNKGVDYLDLLEPFTRDTKYNDDFIAKYFKKLEKLI